MTNESFILNGNLTEEEKSLLALVAVLSIVLCFFPSLIMYLAEKYNSAHGKSFILKTLNFQIILTSVSIAVNYIPRIGLLIWFFIWIFNLMICLKAAAAINKDKKFNYPFDIQFIK